MSHDQEEDQNGDQANEDPPGSPLDPDFSLVTRKRRRRESSPVSDEDSSNSCPICLEPWTNFGQHRLCSLRCGHLFGLECIRRWLNTTSTGRCPSCNRKARRGDIRQLYVRKLMAIDNAELEAIKEGSNLEKRRRVTAEKEIASLKLHIENLGSEIRHLRRKQASVLENSADQRDLWHFESMIRVPLPAGDNARYRVMTQKEQSIVVSRRSVGNHIFSGFGIRRFLNDFGAAEDIHLHGGVIRGLSYQPGRSNLVLSAGFDKTAKITDIHNHLVLLNLPSSSPLWSCCWDQLENNRFFTGSASGTVEVFDLRNPRSTLLEFSNSSPVHSLHFDYTDSHYSLLAGQSHSVSIHLNFLSPDYRKLDFDLNSCISSLAYDRQSRMILSTYKQSTTSSPINRLELYDIDSFLSDSGYRGPLNVFSNPGAGPLFQKSAIFLRPSHPEDVIVCSSDQQLQKLNVFSTGCPHFMRQIPVDGAPLDILFYGEDMLAVINSKSLQIYKFFQKE